MIRRLRSFVGGRSVEIVRECRECGTSVAAGGDRCPHCESTDVARYEID